MSIDANKIGTKEINSLTEDEVQLLFSEGLLQYNGRGERFQIHPYYRIPLLSTLTGIVGFFDGFTHGYTTSGLRYLASNSHRLPRSKMGWYQYHRRKQFVCMSGALVSGAKRGVGYSSIFAVTFTTEALLDELRGCKDFANTAVSMGLMGGIYSLWSGITGSPLRRLVTRGIVLGSVIGLMQDGIALFKGDPVWYMTLLGIHPRSVDI